MPAWVGVPHADEAADLVAGFAVMVDELLRDDWTWTGTGTGLPALTRYLLHAAKLRYQHRVLDRRGDRRRSRAPRWCCPRASRGW